MNNESRRMLRMGAAVLTALLAAHCGGDDDSNGGAGTGGATPSGGSGGAITGSGGKAATAGTGGATAGSGGSAGHSAGSGGASGPAGAGGGGGSGAGGSGAGGGGAGGSGADAGPPAQTWPTADLGADGPFEPMTVSNSGPDDGYMLFFPQDLGRDGLKHPIITWGNGAGSTPGGYTLLPRLATHGFVVIASNSSSVTGDLLLGGIDWLIAENARAGSMFEDKLDPDQVAAMGYSLGSLATFEAAADPRIKTTVHISGGSMNHSVVANLHGPAAFYCGNDSDIAFDNCEVDFDMATVPLIYANFPGGHGGVVGAQSAQITKATVGWMRWRLMGDTTLDAMFVGPDCTLCKDSAWDEVQQKDLDVAP